MIGEQRRAQILAAARRLLDEEGVEAITMRRLGALVGIRGPSLYKHFSSRDQIHVALAIEALAELAGILEPVPRTFTDLAAAYRAWAVEHRHLFQVLNRQPLSRAGLPPGLEERTAAFLVADNACHGDVDLARAAWATMNGLIDLELAGRLAPDVDLAAAYTAAARA